MAIGTLNEGSLHEALKIHYAPPGAALEVPVESFVADVRTEDDQLIEIQTSGFGSMRKKLEKLLPNFPILLVHPIAKIRHIVKLEDDLDTPLGSRKSPKHGKFEDVLDEVVSIPKILNHPNFTLEVVLIEEEEFRVFSGQRRRNGWRVVGRRLVSVLETWRVSEARDLLQLVRHNLPEEFTTADLASGMDSHRSMAQKLAYCLREAGTIELCGKQGNALIYKHAVYKRAC